MSTYRRSWRFHLPLSALFTLCAAQAGAQQVATDAGPAAAAPAAAHPQVAVEMDDYRRQEEAILAVIRHETEAYYREDFEAWKRLFVNEPHFRQFGYWEGYEGKVVHYNGFAALEEVKRRQFERGATTWKGSRETRSDFNVRIYPGVAWVTFEQNSYEGGTDRFLGRSLETRILEMYDGEWKIAYLGFHYFPLTDD